ncbi:MAG: hypothetical protein ABFS46_07765 [Myxococcota bacterium]
MRRLGLLALGLLACAGRPLGASDLVTAHPGLDRAEARALVRTMPYLLPAAGQITWFSCRHETSLPVLVSAAGELQAHEEAALETALATLERSVEGLRFLRVPPDEATVGVEFVEGLVAREEGDDQANTITDCRVTGTPLGMGDPLPARIERASMRIGRGGRLDALGREWALTPEELTGVVIHEVVHALGLQGHGSGGLLSRDLSELARTGRAARAGQTLEDPALAGLYTLPSGTVLGRAAVSPARTQLVDRLARLAAEGEVGGPFIRVGDASARIFWTDARGRDYGLQIRQLKELLREPAELVILPEARTRRALPRSNDLPWP